MLSENKSSSIINLAKEASGYSAYQDILPKLEEENPNWHPLVNKAFAAVWGFCGFEMPVIERIARQGIKFIGFEQGGEYTKFGFMQSALVLREFTGMSLSFGLPVVFGANTGDWALAGGAHLATRFILNGIMHLEIGDIRKT